MPERRPAAAHQAQCSAATAPAGNQRAMLAARLTGVAQRVGRVTERVARDEPPAAILAELAAIRHETREIGLCLLQDDVREHLTATDWPSPAHLTALHADLAAGVRLSRVR